MLFKLLLISFIATLALSDEVCKEQYTEWETATECTDQCGRCGTKMKRRTCMDGCECSGPFEKEVPCPKKQCVHPRPRCCHGFKSTLNMGRKRYECLSEEERKEMNIIGKASEL
ncbi:unnamed protein product, partial [Mesorhabditis belari]|uniref:TIL domain-containing protein n=1 Tax=Mesorhabditis belari TaxID=2138241 RepID=A0AAF3ESV2_9BILA